MSALLVAIVSTEVRELCSAQQQCQGICTLQRLHRVSDVHTIAQHVSHTAVTSLMNISNTLHTVAGTGALPQWDHAMTSAAWPDLVLAAKKCDTEPKPREGCKASPKLQESCNKGFISKANMCCNSVCLAQAACCKQQECPRHCSAWGPQGLNPKA